MQVIWISRLYMLPNCESRPSYWVCYEYMKRTRGVIWIR